jgi:hypothetical protein
MRRVLLLALLALALPIAAMASTIDYAGYAVTTPATVTGGVAAWGSVGLTFHQLAINGGAATTGTVAIAITLNNVSCGASCFNISGGTVTIKNASNVTLFAGTFSSGTAFQANGVLNISGVTTAGTTVAGVLKLNGFGWFGSSNTVVTPEPGTLGLLGTGLVGLAGIVRRKLRAGNLTLTRANK